MPVSRFIAIHCDLVCFGFLMPGARCQCVQLKNTYMNEIEKKATVGIKWGTQQEIAFYLCIYLLCFIF